MRDLDHLCGVFVSDNGELQDLEELIEELEPFVEQFSTHAMSDYALYLQGQKDAYQDVLKYLKRVKVEK